MDGEFPELVDANFEDVTFCNSDKYEPNQKVYLNYDKMTLPAEKSVYINNKRYMDHNCTMIQKEKNKDKDSENSESIKKAKTVWEKPLGPSLVITGSAITIIGLVIGADAVCTLNSGKYCVTSSSAEISQREAAEQDQRYRYQSLAGWTSVGVGVAITVVGGIIWGLAGEDQTVAADPAPQNISLELVDQGGIFLFGGQF